MALLPTKDLWASETLDEVFKALATSPELNSHLIYKGARVLRLRLAEPVRASIDIDASVTFSTNTTAAQGNLEQLRKSAHLAIEEYFETQDTVRFTITNSSITRRRKTPHPRGWDVHWLQLSIRDELNPGFYSGEPNLTIDLSDPEAISSNSVSPLAVDGFAVNALTIERIVGEKLRAFLSCLPNYRKKIDERKIPARRVKDLYDLARIARKHPHSESHFWRIAGQEFHLACESRFVDCHGLETFRDDWQVTEQRYSNDPTIPKDVSLSEATDCLEKSCETLKQLGFIPVTYELPPLPQPDEK